MLLIVLIVSLLKSIKILALTATLQKQGLPLGLPYAKKKLLFVIIAQNNLTHGQDICYIMSYKVKFFYDCQKGDTNDYFLFDMCSHICSDDRHLFFS